MYQNNKKNLDLESTKNITKLLDSVSECIEKLTDSSQSYFTRSQTSIHTIKKVVKTPGLIKKLLKGQHKIFDKYIESQKRTPGYTLFDLGKCTCKWMQSLFLP
jgi:hypothetical protein